MQVQLDDYRLGAAVATDLVNTAAEVMVSTGEQLPDAAALARFLAAHQVVAAAGDPTPADVRAVHRLRRTLRGLLASPDAAAAAALTVAAGTGPALHRDGDGRWQWRVASRPGAPLVDELALLTGTALLSVLRTLGPDRFRACAAPDCAGLFVDTSRAGRRRYCVPEVCGNRVNVAAHRARHRTPR
ncbi:CGNR zinc finger domain-containing protein [Pseudonocardia sichuanensis]|uniref:Putative RNA-binding Zn ribbon-like protein n=1 Tax=Pseudonocardia kunmingensis TaxID=630975 RepID=A0A543D4Q3_9PSEU|nr:CGNR zinc finger domain-containing protein [Pseudonocardia kunmingensis]TQM04327.1 putative RNA-binding Zn ribbon-like protein [Pseudonocardia kunmingensis]